MTLLRSIEYSISFSLSLSRCWQQTIRLSFTHAAQYTYTNIINVYVYSKRVAFSDSFPLISRNVLSEEIRTRSTNSTNKWNRLLKFLQHMFDSIRYIYNTIRREKEDLPNGNKWEWIRIRWERLKRFTFI